MVFCVFSRKGGGYCGRVIADSPLQAKMQITLQERGHRKEAQQMAFLSALNASLLH